MDEAWKQREIDLATNDEHISKLYLILGLFLWP